METTRYELPSEGSTLLGYVVRRMHKTHYLAEIPALLAESNTAQALIRIGFIRRGFIHILWTCVLSARVQSDGRNH